MADLLMNNEKLLQPADPLPEERSAVDEYQRAHVKPRDHAYGCYRLPECRGGREHPGIVPQHLLHGEVLILPELSPELNAYVFSVVCFVLDGYRGFMATEEAGRGLSASSREGKIVSIQFRAGDDPRDIPGREAHGLPAVEFRVFEGCEAAEAGNCLRREAAQGNIEPVCPCEGDALRERCFRNVILNGRFPGSGFFLLLGTLFRLAGLCAEEISSG